MKQSKLTSILGALLQVLLGLGLGGAAGYLIAVNMDRLLSDSQLGLGAEIGLILLMLAGLYLVLFLHLIAHEAGHLIGGLLTGYQFSSFRIGSIVFLKENGKLHLKRMSLAGTGGQCLMAPPELVEGRFPVMLYNLGGPLMNLLLAGLLALVCLADLHPVVLTLLQIGVLMGLFTGLTNGIPLQMGGVHNDGRNALSLGKDPEALRALWIQLKISELTTRGMRLKDMPDEWFTMPAPEALQNNLIAALAVFRCNRAMDRLELDQAEAEMTALLAAKTGMMPMYRSLLGSELLFCELMGQNRPERLEQLRTKEVRQFMKAMKTYPSVLRTQYAWEKLHTKNEGAAAKVLAQFEKTARRHPYPSEIEGERELLALVDAKGA